jgi:hypothetical protein
MLEEANKAKQSKAKSARFVKNCASLTHSQILFGVG